MRRAAAVAGGVVASAVWVAAVAGHAQVDVSGLVPNNASWAYYQTERMATDYNYGVRLRTLSWSGSDQYYYLRRCDNDNPIGAGTPNNPVRAAVGDDTFKQLGPVTGCFRMTAKKDFTWFSGSSWWTGTLRY